MKPAHVIITYGGGETLEQVFNSIALVFKDNEFMNAMYIAAVLFGFWVVITALSKGDGFMPIKWFVWFVISTELVLLPKTSVLIKDPLTKFERPVANVPYVLGSFASAMSSVGDVLTKRMESYFTLPDYLEYNQTGSVFASKLFRQMGQFKIKDGVLKGNLHRFIQNCVVYDAMVGVKYDIKELQNSKNILELVSDTGTIVGFTYQQYKGGGSKIVSCKEGIGMIKTVLAGETDNLASHLGAKLGIKSAMEVIPGEAVGKAVATEFKTRLTSSFNFMTKIGESADDILKQEMMINAIGDATKNKAEELGSPHNYASSKALLQQRSTYNVVGEIAAQTLAVTKIIFEVLAYTAFIFIALLMMMPNGLQMLLNYLGLIMWIQLWPPLYAVLNLVVNVAARHQSQGIAGSDGLTMLTSVGFSNLHADMEALAGYLSMSIPFISYAIVKGGAATFMNLAGSLSSGYQAAAASAANEVTSGNLSMKNISYANSNMHSFSGFKHDSNLSHQSGRMDMGNNDGSVSFATASGATGFKAGAGLTTSTWGHQLNIQSHLSSQNSQALQQEQANQVGLSHEYSTAESQAVRSASTVLERMGKAGVQGRSWSVGGSTEQSLGVNETVSFMKELQERHGYSSAQAAEVATGIGIGASAFGVSGNASTNFRSQADYQEALNRGQQLAEGKGYTESIQKALRHMDQVSFSESEQFEKGLARDVSSSLDKMSSTRDAMNVSKQKIDKLSESQSFIDSHGAMFNIDAGQQLVDYIARQKVNTSSEFFGEKKEIGSIGAQKIIRAQDDVYYTHVKGFFKDVMPRMMDQIPTGRNTGLDMSSMNPTANDSRRSLTSGTTSSAPNNSSGSYANYPVSHGSTDGNSSRMGSPNIEAQQNTSSNQLGMNSVSHSANAPQVDSNIATQSADRAQPTVAGAWSNTSHMPASSVTNPDNLEHGFKGDIASGTLAIGSMGVGNSETSLKSMIPSGIPSQQENVNYDGYANNPVSQGSQNVLQGSVNNPDTASGYAAFNNQPNMAAASNSGDMPQTGGSEAKKSIAAEAKVWSGAPHMPAGNDSPTLTKFGENLRGQVSSGMTAMPDNLDNFDLSSNDFSKLKEQVTSANHQQVHKVATENINSFNPEFSTTFDNKFKDNMNKLNEPQDIEDIDKKEGLSSTVKEHYTSGLNTMTDKEAEIRDKKPELEKEYKENHEQSHIEKVVKGVIKDRKE